MRSGILILLSFILANILSLQTGWAERRVALVIGNSGYEHVSRLPNPENDATAISASLERLGFAVRKVENLTYDAMRRTLRDFGSEAAGADVALVFYAGHGIEVNNQNYVIPVDARLKRDRDIDYEAVPLDLLTQAVADARGLKLVLLDACRDNPFAASMKRTSGTRSIGRGLSRVEPAQGILVSYAAKEGTTADDGSGANSPYTEALLAHLEQPGLEINFLFRKVRDHVLASTGGRQEPFTYGSLPGKQIYLRRSEAAETRAPEAQEDAVELVYWNTVKDSGDPKLLGSYLIQFPEGRFKSLAVLLMDKAKLAALPKNEEPAPKQTVPKLSRSELVERIQGELKKAKCYKGEVDGKWGTGSQKALLQFLETAKASIPELSPTPQALAVLSSVNVSCAPVKKTVKKTTSGSSKSKSTSSKSKSTFDWEGETRKCKNRILSACKRICARGGKRACRAVQRMGG